MKYEMLEIENMKALADKFFSQAEAFITKRKKGTYGRRRTTGS